MEIVTPTGHLRVKAHPTSKIQPGGSISSTATGRQTPTTWSARVHLDPYSGFPGYRANRCAVSKG